MSLIMAANTLWSIPGVGSSEKKQCQCLLGSGIIGATKSENVGQLGLCCECKILGASSEKAQT